MKARTTSKGFTLSAGTPLVFPASLGRSSLFVVNTSVNDMTMAFGENPLAADFIPVVGDNGHFAPIVAPTGRITFKSVIGGAMVIMSDSHKTLAQVHPKIYVHPESHMASSGTTLLSVTVANPDGMTFQWVRDGSDVGSNSTTYNGSYTENAYVHVEVTNAGKTVSSEKALITIV
jgi:hypothetical protein